MKRAHITVHGYVQGVFFRAGTRDLARKLGITGWARNIPEGVEIVAEGDEKALKELIAYCNKGPRIARVEKVTVSYSRPTGEFVTFEVRY